MKSIICLVIFHTAVFGEKFPIEVGNGPKKKSNLSSHKSEGNDYMARGDGMVRHHQPERGLKGEKRHQRCR